MANDSAKIARCLRWMANILIEESLTNNMSNYLATKVGALCKSLKSIIDWDNLTQDDLTSLGFLLWNETDDCEIWLIPMYLMPTIPEGFKVETSNGELIEFKMSDADYTSIYGCCKYGVRVNGGKILQ